MDEDVRRWVELLYETYVRMEPPPTDAASALPRWRPEVVVAIEEVLEVGMGITSEQLGRLDAPVFEVATYLGVLRDLAEEASPDLDRRWWTVDGLDERLEILAIAAGCPGALALRAAREVPRAARREQRRRRDLAALPLLAATLADEALRDAPRLRALARRRRDVNGTLWANYASIHRAKCEDLVDRSPLARALTAMLDEAKAFRPSVVRPSDYEQIVRACDALEASARVVRYALGASPAGGEPS